MPKLRIASCNEQGRVPLHQFAVDLGLLRALGVDAAGLQEIGNDKRERVLRRLAGYRVHRPHRGKPTPVIWRARSLRFVAAGTIHLTDSEHVGRAGAGPATLKTKYIVWVKFVHKRSKREIVVANIHAAPSIYLEVRDELHEEQMAGIAEAVKVWQEQGYLVFVTGDFNAENDNENLKPLREAGLASNYDRLGKPKFGTHGRRYIDFVWSTHSRLVRGLGQRVLRRVRSDHNWLVVTFDIRRKRRH